MFGGLGLPLAPRDQEDEAARRSGAAERFPDLLGISAADDGLVFLAHSGFFHSATRIPAEAVPQARISGELDEETSQLLAIILRPGPFGPSFCWHDVLQSSGDAMQKGAECQAIWPRARGPAVRHIWSGRSYFPGTVEPRDSLSRRRRVPRR